jgi:hypothetical protein
LEKRKAVQLQDLEVRKVNRETDIDLDNKEMNAQLERLRQVKEMEAAEARLKHEQELAAKAQELEHAQEMEEKRLKEISIKYQASKDLSPEQLMAIAANEKLDPIAAQKFAESFSAKHNSANQKEFMEQFNKLNENRIQDAKDMMDRMERMFNKGLDSSAAMTSHLVESKDQQKAEYKQRLERQEDRMDKTQDKALDYTTRNNSFGNVNSGANVPPPPVDYFVNLPGENNIPRKMEELINMVKNGLILRKTNVFSPIQNAWIPSENIPELLPFFPPDANAGPKTLITSKTCKRCGFGPLETEARFCPECGNEP